MFFFFQKLCNADAERRRCATSMSQRPKNVYWWHSIVATLCLFSIGCPLSEPRINPTAQSNKSASNPGKKLTESAPGQELPSPLRSVPTINRSPDPVSLPFFREIAIDVGIDFTYQNGESGKGLMVEPMGGGVGWLDYDRDGLLDVYVTQGGDPTARVRVNQPTDELFRQAPGRFENSTLPSGIVERRYSMGVSVADFDDDGFEDVYVTNVGPNSFFQNKGDGTFREVGVSAGVADPRWGTSAAWSDLDGDGDLDLYVCNYVDYDPHHPTPCGDGRICHPRAVAPSPDECYFNQSDGTFRAEAAKRGLFGPENRSLGVAIADLNNDHLPDIYVANDSTANFLFINQGGGQFRESAVTLGCAVSREGLPQASMGVALGDYDQNGWLDLYCTHLTDESNTLYHNLGLAGFQDVTGLVGLHAATLPMLGFGTVMADFNQDRHEDLFVANGHIDDWQKKGREQRPQLFSFAGPRFVEAGSKAGAYFERQVMGRGVAMGDFDQDGDWDLLVVHQGVPTSLLRNDSQRGHWLKLTFLAKANRRGIGTRVTLKQAERVLVQELAGGTSYCSSHEPALIFGLGDVSTSCELEIRWPDSTIETLTEIPVDQSLQVKKMTSDKPR